VTDIARKPSGTLHHSSDAASLPVSETPAHVGRALRDRQSGSPPPTTGTFPAFPAYSPKTGISREFSDDT